VSFPGPCTNANASDAGPDMVDELEGSFHSRHEPIGRWAGRRTRIVLQWRVIVRLACLYVTVAWRLSGLLGRRFKAENWLHVARGWRFDYPQEIQSAGHLTTNDTWKSLTRPSPTVFHPTRACMAPFAWLQPPLLPCCRVALAFTLHLTTTRAALWLAVP
jgi:hypothetical protein